MDAGVVRVVMVDRHLLEPCRKISLHRDSRSLQLVDRVGPGRGRSSPTPSGPEEPPWASGEPVLRPRPLAWAELLWRVFALDVLDCPRCGGRMRLIAAIQPPDVTAAILDCLDLPSRGPPTFPAIPDPEKWPGDFEASF